MIAADLRVTAHDASDRDALLVYVAALDELELADLNADSHAASSL
jgi:hypothetical protein